MLTWREVPGGDRGPDGRTGEAEALEELGAFFTAIYKE
jgi:hypothetical protein